MMKTPVPGPQSPVRPRSRVPDPVLVTAAGAALGALLWMFSGVLWNREQAWSEPGPYYLSLIVCGALASLISPRWFLLSAVGVYLGQAIYMALCVPRGYYGNLDFVLLGPLSTVSIVGGWIVYAGFRKKIR